MSDIAHIDPAMLIERAVDPGQFVVDCLERGKTWLAEALEHGDLEQLVNCKGWAATLRTATMQKQLGKDAELSATELVRRAERCIVQGVRAGQAAGTIATRADGGPKKDYLRGGQTVHVPHQSVKPKKVSPSAYIGTGRDAMCMAALADDVSDDQFEDAIADAKSEGNLSRANVARKAKGETKPKPADRHEVHHNGRRIDPVRIIEETINTLDGVAMGLALIDDIPSLDAAQRQEWSEALRQPLAAINKFNRELKA